MEKIDVSKFPAVSNTALMTLYCRAKDYTSKKSILHDKLAYDLYTHIETDWKKIGRKIFGHDIICTAVRVRKFDRMCQQFLSASPNGIIISLGSGIDHRFGRIDNGTCTFIDLDFP